MSALLHADWPAPPGVHALTTLRHGAGASPAPFDSFNLGNCTAVDGDHPVVVQSNREQLRVLAGLPAAPRWLRQVHGIEALRFGPGGQSTIESAGAPHGRDAFAADGLHDAASGPVADAAVTDCKGVVLAILSADCLPVVLAARDGSEVAAAHAGWRGLAGGVLERTLAAMATPVDQLKVWLGPAAGPDAYEVGSEVFEAFVERDPATAHAFIATRPGHWRVDLYALARHRLRLAGVSDVHGGGLCTISDPARFHSHRRDGRSGRMATLAWIAP